MTAKLKKRRVRSRPPGRRWQEWPDRTDLLEKPMGRFSVDVQVANYGDILHAEQGTLDPDKVRRVTIRGVVDPGASRLVLPKAVVDQLGLPRRGRTRVRYADGRTAWRDNVQGVWLSLQGREAIYVAVVEPKRDSALIGAIVLEDLDFLVDCKTQQLVPRDPKGILSEIE